MNMKRANCCAAGMLYVMSSGLAWAGTEGTDSTFYGHNAGLVNSDDANENTFIGAGAGHDNTTGIQNTFLGRQAGFSHVDGSYNTFLGRFAGRASTNSSYNTFVGEEAGASVASGTGNTFIGYAAGYLGTGGNFNTFIGELAGANSTSQENTFVGQGAGYSNISGHSNTALGVSAGLNNLTGNRNLFLGYSAGRGETGSNKLYIDNCVDGIPCTTPPLIYGEFDNRLLNINGVTSVAANNVAKSQMHFSLDNGDYGGFLTSVLQNNFFVSSGARFDSGNWVQRSADGRAVAAGSGSVGYRIFTSTGHAVGEAFDISTSVRLYINYNGEFGINGAPVAGHEIHTGSGAYLAGGTWTDASSRAYKHDIRELPAAAAADALAALNPVTFRYNDDGEQQHVGFIAEDVPELVAMKDRKGLSPMDIVAVLTKVVQEKSRTLDAVVAELGKLRAEMQQLKGRVN